MGRREFGSGVGRVFFLLPVLLATGGFGVRGDDGGDETRFSLTEPIVCREIRGYEDYETLKTPTLTADDKLLIYFVPLHYKTSKVGDHHEARFTQDGKIRRRGEKAVLWTKKDLLEDTAKATEPPRQVYLRNSIGLKALKPGEYEFDIILRDEVGKSAPALRSVPFRVIPTAPPAGDATPPGRDIKVPVRP